MAPTSELPRFVIHIVSEGGGFRPHVALTHQFVFRGELCLTLKAARVAAAEFVIGRPEEQRELVWAKDEPLWVGGEEIGRISVEPLSSGGCTHGWVRPHTERTAFTALMEEGLEHSRQWATGPDRDDAADRCFANGEAIVELGMAVGQPPRPVENLNVMGDWHMFLCLGAPQSPDADPVPAGT